MFIDYKSGEKHTGKIDQSDLSESMDAFRDCGQLIENNEVVIDIDHLPKDSIRALIKEFSIKTMTVWTDRGVHFWFKKPVNFLRRKDGVCMLGFEIEQHTKSSNPGGMTVKRNGVAREIENPELRQYMPEFFRVKIGKHPYKDLTGMEEGDGRNKALFEHRKALNDCKDWERYLNFINQHIFAEPMTEEEFNGITRDLDINNTDLSDRYFIANHVMEEFKTVTYSGLVWWYLDDEYVADPDNARLIRKVYPYCEGKDTRDVDEVIKQIGYRSPYIPDGEVFPIKLKNGIIHKGRFIPMSSYTEFTPYYIDIEYKPDAEPVEIVDKYIDELTSKDPDYRKLLMEVIGYVMITDPEKIRSLGKFFMFRGDGANGKGTLLQIMKRIYNERNCTNLSIKQLVDDRFKVTMIGMLANLGDDIEAEAIDDAQLKVLKNISTADTVATRRLFAQSQSATFTIKLYFTTNTDIRSFEKGYAYKRRILWLPMFNKVDKPDPQFITKITTKEALEYWIRLIVEGYQRLYQNNAWTDSRIVDDYNEQYHEDNNIMWQYAKDIDPDEEIRGKTISEIREDYYKWASDDRKFSSKLFQDAVWDQYKLGLGKQKINGKTRQVFMYQKDTSQRLHN